MPHRSFWLQEVAGDAPDAPALEGDARADVAILGGGYVGLWTALRIKELEPSRDVVVLEQDICGGGASGRNGGFVLSWWSKLSSLVSLCGAADALVRRARLGGGDRRDPRLLRGAFDRRALSTGRMALDGDFEGAARRVGRRRRRRRESSASSRSGALTPEEVARRTGSPAHRAGVFDPSAATVQPAALARGLRRAALEAGVRIFENTRVRSFSRERRSSFRPGAGKLTADKLVIAANAWAAGIPELSRAIVAITSDMVMTAPVADRLAQIGWTGGECVTDSQMMVDYYHATREGRVAFGKGGWGIAYGGRIGADFDRNAVRARTVAADLRRYYPELRDVGDHARLVGADRPHAQQSAAHGPPRRAAAHPLWRRLERQRRGPESWSAEGSSRASSSRRTTTGAGIPSSDAPPAASRRSRSAGSARTSSAAPSPGRNAPRSTTESRRGSTSPCPVSPRRDSRTRPLMTDASAPRSVAGELARLAGSPVRGGTEIRLLRDGEEAFPAMLEAIAAAKTRVVFENFIFAGDATGQRFAEALSEAARRGVEVRVLYDPIGTMMVRGGSIAAVLKKEGVTARPFRPLSLFAPWSWLRMRHRDHRKSLVVDSETAVVGGLCISDNWAPSEKGGNGWRDTALLVRGEIARDVERAFEAMWRRAIGGRSSRRRRRRRPANAPPAAILAEDLPETERVAAIYEWLAGTARSTLEITDAYMVAPPKVLAAFGAAARRGVTVSILLPGRNNHPLAGAAARRVYQGLLDAGVRIYEWSGVMIHAKTAVADGEIGLVGSSNLDPLSMTRNYELNLLVVDPATGAAMRAMFARDLEHACRVEPAGWRLRPRWQKAAERAAGILGGGL